MKIRAVRVIPKQLPPPTGQTGIGHFRLADNATRIHPHMDAWVCERLLAGWHPKAIVLAVGGAFSLRTAYRWKRSLTGLAVVEMGGFEATFAIRRDGPPSRLTSWSRQSAMKAA